MILGNYKHISLTEVRNKIINNFHKELIKRNENKCKKHDYCKYCYYCPTYSINGFMQKTNILCEDAKAYQIALERRLKKN